MVRIKYITLYSVEYLCRGPLDVPVWSNAKVGIDNINAMEFEDETEARLFLLKNKYDLPHLQVMFEPVVREEAPKEAEMVEGRQWVVTQQVGKEVLGVYGPFNSWGQADKWVKKMNLSYSTCPILELDAPE